MSRSPKTASRSTTKSSRTGSKKKAAKRELINTGTGKRYVRRDPEGKFREVDDQHRSLSQDRRRKAKTVVKSGQGDRRDQKRR